MKINVLVSTTVDSLVEIDDQMNMNDEEIKQFCSDILNGKEINEYPLNYNVAWSISSHREYDIVREKDAEKLPISSHEEGLRHEREESGK